MSFLLLILLGLLAIETPVSPDRPPMEVKGADRELLEEVRILSKKIETVRGQRFERPPIAVRAPETLRSVAADIRTSSALGSEQLEARGRAWSDVGFGTTDSPRLLMTTLAGDLAGVWLDPDANRLLVSPDRLSPRDFEPKEEIDDSAAVLMLAGVRRDEPLLAHQLVHLRQRERQGGDSLGPTTDALLVQSAWAEGEANLVAVRHLFEGMGLQDQIIELTTDPADFLGGALVPPPLESPSVTVEALIRFVYLEGFARTVEAFRAGGWNGLDHTVARAGTTRDLLNPADPLRSRSFCEPAFASPRPGWKMSDLDTLGQQGIIALLSTLTGKDNLALIGAEGWRGDCLYRFEAPEGSPAGLTVWETQWTSTEGAADFEYAFARTLSVRFPGQKLQQTAPGQRHLATGGRVLRLERQGATVRIQVAAEAIDTEIQTAKVRPSE